MSRPVYHAEQSIRSRDVPRALCITLVASRRYALTRFRGSAFNRMHDWRLGRQSDRDRKLTRLLIFKEHVTTTRWSSVLSVHR